MLSCKGLTVKNRGHTILNNITTNFTKNSFNAIVGPSGCGKTTLLKALLKLIPYEGGISLSQDTNLKTGFVPQFSVCYEDLTVEQVLRYQFKLFNESKSSISISNQIEELLTSVELKEVSNNKVLSLSGGQKRRLSLALEILLNPNILFCDEVTSGLDPASEELILNLIKSLSSTKEVTSICVIHNLMQLEKFDNITVLSKGELIFQGTYNELLKYFNLEHISSLYTSIDSQELKYWIRKWNSKEINQNNSTNALNKTPKFNHSYFSNTFNKILKQSLFLLQRRYQLFFSNFNFLLLTLSITIGFPIVVILFALNGLPEIQNLSLDRSNLSITQDIQQVTHFTIEQINLSHLITGLIMFQVILLTLMGANNGSREISSERKLYEKERVSNLNIFSYSLSKIIFVSSLAIFQGLWMTIFVKYICKFPGSLLSQSFILCLTCVSMSLLCLGFSSLCKSSEKSSLLSIYLVGFQLPLSGVVLALPDYLVWIFRPFITTYWGWSGYMSSMKDTYLFDAFRSNNTEWISSLYLSLTILLIHCLIGILLVIYGNFKKQNSL